jgi:hypothetical protein|tara:strand:- start:1143 stop:1292 length:150 start_codon:yes stop_codon:yes gene_type:complete
MNWEEYKQQLQENFENQATADGRPLSQKQLKNLDKLIEQIKSEERGEEQ